MGDIHLIGARGLIGILVFLLVSITTIFIRRLVICNRIKNFRVVNANNIWSECYCEDEDIGAPISIFETLGLLGLIFTLILISKFDILRESLSKKFKSQSILIHR